MFWGLVLEPSKKYTQKVDQTFHISQAALDLKSCDQEPIQLVVEYENSNFVLATLSKKANIFQVPLDLVFKTGDQVSFRTIGNGKVHLSGYHVLDDLDSVIMNGEEESDVEEAEEVIKGKGKRKKPAVNFKGKKAKLEDFNEEESEDDDLDEDGEDMDEDDDDDDDEDEDDSEEDNILVGKKADKKKQKGKSFLDSMAEEADEDEDDELYEEDEDDEEDDDDDDDYSDLDEIDSDELSGELDDKNKKKAGKLNVKKNAQTPNGVDSTTKGKDKSPQKLNKSLKQTPKKEVKTPKSEKKQGPSEATPQRKNSEGQKKEEKTPKSPKSEGSPQKKVLEGGVISEEIKMGTGPVAKPGKMANVYYVGTLAATKKEFDSVQSGGGFKFRIGRNEVIKGWDIGINGMKVGGKRRLTIPPHLAYGSRGSPPVIPPNSTLVFTVELKGLS